MPIRFDLQAMARDEVKGILERLQRGRCLMTNRQGTDLHEVIFKRSDRPGEGTLSALWHPYNCVLLDNTYHLKLGNNALHALKHISYLMRMYGVKELDAYIRFVSMRTGAKTVDMWVNQRANKIAKAVSVYTVGDDLWVEDANGRHWSFDREWVGIENEFSN